MPETTQQYIDVSGNEVLSITQKMKGGNYRLVQICATRNAEDFTLLYSFSRDEGYIPAERLKEERTLKIEEELEEDMEDEDVEYEEDFEDEEVLALKSDATSKEIKDAPKASKEAKSASEDEASENKSEASENRSEVSEIEEEIAEVIEEKKDFVNVRVTLGLEEAIESISRLYSYAFIYENEIKDMFGVKIEDIIVDFHGNFYKTRIKEPFKKRSENEWVNRR